MWEYGFSPEILCVRAHVWVCVNASSCLSLSIVCADGVTYFWVLLSFTVILLAFLCLSNNCPSRVPLTCSLMELPVAVLSSHAAADTWEIHHRCNARPFRVFKTLH